MRLRTFYDFELHILFFFIIIFQPNMLYSCYNILSLIHKFIFCKLLFILQVLLQVTFSMKNFLNQVRLSCSFSSIPSQWTLVHKNMHHPSWYFFLLSFFCTYSLRTKETCLDTIPNKISDKEKTV